ncbi:hypothetical protein J2X69_003431 [Algoriphagus sp. 4150]|uniref:hypothetical protein n=1 Tax=Algoriphagus sp. 4150 TaxID=2817756 RepID=UPI0028606F1A|nr:hypothetical protein [Algoriphagus sp. 4150]MDR7131072.1 hypothetical protein [Algoriphagus sp. 4150]
MKQLNHNTSATEAYNSYCIMEDKRGYILYFPAPKQSKTHISIRQGNAGTASAGSLVFRAGRGDAASSHASGLRGEALLAS